MRFTATTCYLTSFLTLLVVVTMSLPQPGFGNAVYSRPANHDPPPNWIPPQGCSKVGAIDHHLDLNPLLAKRSSQSPETHPGALEQRMINLYCGVLNGVGQTNYFGFETSSPSSSSGILPAPGWRGISGAPTSSKRPSGSCDTPPTARMKLSGTCLPRIIGPTCGRPLRVPTTIFNFSHRPPCN